MTWPARLALTIVAFGLASINGIQRGAGVLDLIAGFMLLFALVAPRAARTRARDEMRQATGGARQASAWQQVHERSRSGDTAESEDAVVGRALAASWALYHEPVTADIEFLHRIYALTVLQEIDIPADAPEAGGASAVLISLARHGHAFRRYEESIPGTDPVARVLVIGNAEWERARPDLDRATLVLIQGDNLANPPGDAWAGLGAVVPPIGASARQAAAKVTLSTIGQDAHRDPSPMPDDVLERCWRFGYITRAFEAI